MKRIVRWLLYATIPIAIALQFVHGHLVAEFVFACAAVLGLTAGRVLQGQVPAPVLSASAALAIALASVSAMAPNDPGFVPYLIGGLIAGGASFLPVSEPSGA